MRRFIKIACLCAICLPYFSFAAEQTSEKKYELEPFVENPRVFYGEIGKPTKADSRAETCEELTSDEIKLIQDCISEITKKPIWFVRLPLMSSPCTRISIKVYLAPDFMNTRFRSGQLYLLNIEGKEKPVIRFEAKFSLPYIQVSLPGEEFSQKLGTPKVCELPFQYPSPIISGSKTEYEDMTQEEIINVLDYLHDPNTYPHSEKEQRKVEERTLEDGTKKRDIVYIPAKQVIYEKIHSQPVESIKKEKDTGQIIATLGFVHNGLFARCTTYTLKKTEQGYEIIKSMSWIS